MRRAKHWRKKFAGTFLAFCALSLAATSVSGTHANADEVEASRRIDAVPFKIAASTPQSIAGGFPITINGRPGSLGELLLDGVPVGSVILDSAGSGTIYVASYSAGRVTIVGTETTYTAGIARRRSARLSVEILPYANPLGSQITKDGWIPNYPVGSPLTAWASGSDGGRVVDGLLSGPGPTMSTSITLSRLYSEPNRVYGGNLVLSYVEPTTDSPAVAMLALDRRGRVLATTPLVCEAPAFAPYDATRDRVCTFVQRQVTGRVSVVIQITVAKPARLSYLANSGFGIPFLFSGVPSTPA
jgi:hypothetical protein